MNDGTPTYRMTWPMERIEARLGRSLRDEIDDRYNRRGQTLAEIGADLGVGPTTVHRWMRTFGLEARFPGRRGTAS